MSITRTQVRIPDEIHTKLKDFATKNDTSMNEAIVRLIGDGVLMDSIEDVDNKNEYIAIIDNCIPKLSTNSVREICKLASHLVNMESIT